MEEPPSVAPAINLCCFSRPDTNIDFFQKLKTGELPLTVNLLHKTILFGLQLTVIRRPGFSGFQVSNMPEILPKQ